jgi:sugar phosphate isomerase/epimerase
MQGNVPWTRVIDALRKTNYSGWAIVEVSPYHVHPEQALFDSATALRRLLT